MTAPQLWPVFICYRRVDGGAAARRLYEMLDKWETVGPENQPIQIDAYLDETMPGIANWKALHRPYLEKARAIIVICTPGAKINEGPDDWVHKEIDWWLAHREVAPILVDPLMEGLRYVPSQIAGRWPDIQRIPLVEKEWIVLSGHALEQKTTAIRRQVIGAILPSGAAIYEQELAAEKQRCLRLTIALAAAGLLLLAVAVAAGVAYDRHVVRPEKGRLVATMPGGLQIVVLGPSFERLQQLYALTEREAERVSGTVSPLLPPDFAASTIEHDASPLMLSVKEDTPQTACRPSDNANQLAGGSYADASIPNLASTVLTGRGLR